MNEHRVVERGPERCANGHRHGPNRTFVDFALCDCDKAIGRGHTTWTCRVCGDVQFADGHTEHRKLIHTPPALPRGLRIPPE